MSDHIDRAAEVIWHTSRRDEGTISATGAKIVAQALADAGRLATYPRLAVEGDWLIEQVDYHTCGAGPGSGAGHEPGCGTVPVGRLATLEHDREQRAGALRYAAGVIGSELLQGTPVTPQRLVEVLYNVADGIEAGADDGLPRPGGES